jgi:hypothetical protein
MKHGSNNDDVVDRSHRSSSPKDRSLPWHPDFQEVSECLANDGAATGQRIEDRESPSEREVKHLAYAVFRVEALEREKDIVVEVLVTHQFDHGAAPSHGQEP